MFRIGVGEVATFVVLSAAAYLIAPSFFEFPALIASAVVLAIIAFFAHYYFKFLFHRVVLVRGLGVAVTRRNFQLEKIRANPEVWSIIGGLRNSHVTAVMWSMTQDFDESTYKKFGLSKYFDKCFYPSDFNTSDPKTYLRGIMGRLGVNAGKIVLIDSDENGIAAGKSLGMTVVKYSSAHQLREDLNKIGL